VLRAKAPPPPFPLAGGDAQRKPLAAFTSMVAATGRMATCAASRRQPQIRELEGGRAVAAGASVAPQRALRPPRRQTCRSERTPSPGPAPPALISGLQSAPRFDLPRGDCWSDVPDQPGPPGQLFDAGFFCCRLFSSQAAGKQAARSRVSLPVQAGV